jgi:hypothetical protein
MASKSFIAILRFVDLVVIDMKIGELHALILPYSLPPPRRLELDDIARSLAAGKYKNVIVLVGAGVSSRFILSVGCI